MPFANDCLDIMGASPSRMQTLSVGQNCIQKLTLQLRSNADGTVCDLTQFGDGSSSSSLSSSPNPVKHGVEIVIKNTFHSIIYKSLWAVIDDPVDGKVSFQTTTAFVDKPGLYLGMAIVWQEGVQRQNFPFYLQITASLDHQSTGPLTIAEVRMSMRDTFPDVNFLLDATEFSDEEIVLALRSCIEYWNEALPPVAPHTTEDFPYRYNWRNAAIGELLLMISLWLRRNDLDYSAAGVQIMDTKKWPEYYKIGMQKKQEWQEWVKGKKVSINLSGAYSTLTGYTNTPYR